MITYQEILDVLSKSIEDPWMLVEDCPSLWDPRIRKMPKTAVLHTIVSGTRKQRMQKISEVIGRNVESTRALYVVELEALLYYFAQEAK